MLSIRSSTLPAGVYALNGTINAIAYEGDLTELSSLQYNSILSATSDWRDKVGNVLIGDGVGIIMIPRDLDLPYHRLDDSNPIQPTGTWQNVTSNTHSDNNSMVLISKTYANFNQELINRQVVCGAPVTFNFNATGAFGVTVEFAYSTVNTVNQASGWIFSVQCLDIAGNVVDGLTYGAPAIGLAYVNDPMSCAAHFEFPSASAPITVSSYKHVAALQITVSAETNYPSFNIDGAVLTTTVTN